jgi:hypothetical protein
MRVKSSAVLVLILTLGTLAYAAGPAISSISPMSATAGDSAFILIVNGANFKNTSMVLWNGGQRATSYLNGSTLQATIGAGDIASGGTASITVQTGSTTSAAVTFTINATASSAVPAITSITPLATAAGSARCAGPELPWQQDVTFNSLGDRNFPRLYRVRVLVPLNRGYGRVRQVAGIESLGH